MKKSIKLLLIVVIIAVLIVSIVCGLYFTLFSSEKHDLVFCPNEFTKNATPTWIDDFNGTELNTNNWNIYEGAHLGAYWTKDNINVNDGNLVISTNFDGEYFYTGALYSKNKYNSHYGYYEIRCILPKAYGIWSSFWMLPVDQDKYEAGATKIAKDEGAEIDIFEGAYAPRNTVQSAVHVGGFKAQKQRVGFNFLFKDFGDIYDSYHTYGVYWDENIYIFYVDGVETWATSYSGNISAVDSFMNVWVEVGGKDVDGKPTIGHAFGNPFLKKPDNKHNDWSTSSDYVIDYVRHYSLDTIKNA